MRVCCGAGEGMLEVSVMQRLFEAQLTTKQILYGPPISVTSCYSQGHCV